MQLVCFSPVHLGEPACSSSWPEAVSAPPSAPPVSAAHCPAAPATAAPLAPPALASEEHRKENRDVLTSHL